MCDQHTEFRERVRAFHAARRVVILDVVYNHTGEGNHVGAVNSFKGLDNDTYYILSGWWTPYTRTSRVPATP